MINIFKMPLSFKERIPFLNRISVRITIIVITILLIGIGITVFYFLNSQNDTIIESTESSIREESGVLFVAIKNNMLAGEAMIAVELFRDLARTRSIGEIRLFRANGVPAFTDNSTISTVNENLGTDQFTLTERIKGVGKNTEPEFKKSSETVDDVLIKDFGGIKKNIIVYKPLINQPHCSRCHGLDHVVRGVIKITSPVDIVFQKTRMNIILSSVIYGALVLLLSLAIVIFLHFIVINRIFDIGRIVEGVGAGDLKTKIAMGKVDEIGTLAKRINDMIDGLSERFKLSRFVSKSTIDYVKEAGEVAVGGEKRVMTVLFSDIRGFTGFSEKRDPQDVMRQLNEVMNIQGEIIQEFAGDIDKFVGDEVIAVFEGDDMALRAVRAAVKIRDTLKVRSEKHHQKLYVGIGINTGEMISGNMGTMERLDRTVIGDSVNLGSRLCQSAGANTIIISEYCYNLVKDKIVAKEHNPIMVKGKEKPVKIYTVRSTI